MFRPTLFVLVVHTVILQCLAQYTCIEIPEVNEYVSSMQDQFGRWTGYRGPTKAHHHHHQIHHTHHPKPSEAPASCSYWLDEIKHQGVAAFNNDSSYTVYRNVKDFGAKGDGVTDDTASINNAISSGGRLGPASGQSSTTTLAVVYFPSGIYVVSSSIVDFYYTQLIGNPNCMPILLPTTNFTGLGVIDGDVYQAGGVLGFGATGVFYRQVRNFIIDMTDIPASSAATGIHWPTAQATSLQNILFVMSQDAGTQHQGVLVEQGSGGWMTDLTFEGGLYGLNVGNQQFTMRNMTFRNIHNAINQAWDWGWTYKNMNIINCSIGLNMSTGGPTAQSVGSVILIDSSITDTPIGVLTAHDATSQPPASGALVLENVNLQNVPIAVQGPANTTALAGTTSSTNIAAWAEGHSYTPDGPQNIEQIITPNARPSSLLASGGAFYERSKPQYASYPASSFVSARSSGATGNGIDDDTQALQGAILTARASGRILFMDAGTYRVSRTLYVPAGSKIVGEGYTSILSSGSFFERMSHPQPVVQIGRPDEGGQVELSDLIISTQSDAASKTGQAGAILIEYNLASPSSAPSGLWDVHTRISGFLGSNQQGDVCPTTAAKRTPPTPINNQCIAAYLSMHVTPSASGLYMENNWFWTADHDLDATTGGNITVYTGRGFLVESAQGAIWLYGTAVEHHAKYQYQFVNTCDVVMGQIQTETPYYQPNPEANLPFPYVGRLHDPVFSAPGVGGNGTQANSTTGIPKADAWGARFVNSNNMLVYGAGLYSFYDDYSTTCSDQGNGEVCQNHILSVENSQLSLYDLHTVGTHYMISLDGRDMALFSENLAGFTDEIAVFRT
ncbi:MAG: hypothetical protein M1828_006935 [Chrysothrix sp. TS-e1954]|nr:MAG: hypothetical protein M1828_006935 [Chrysothrix sp. TS-e1954]